MFSCLGPPLGISVHSCEREHHWETLLRFLLIHHPHVGQKAAPGKQEVNAQQNDLLLLSVLLA